MKFERKKRNSNRTLILLVVLLVVVAVLMMMLPDVPTAPDAKAVKSEPAPVPTEQTDATGDAAGGCEQTETINE